MRRRLTPSCKSSVTNTTLTISLTGKEWWLCPVLLDHLLKVSDLKKNMDEKKKINLDKFFVGLVARIMYIE